MKTKNSGKSPWTASPEPVRSAAKHPSAPKPSAVNAPSTTITSAQPASVDGEEDRGKEDDREQLEGLAQRLEHRAPREHADLVSHARASLRARRCGEALGCALSSSAPAPSSERPVLARKTSSSV